jgi:hypothetical protein
MEFGIELKRPTWTVLATIPKDTVLIKGRTSPIARALAEAASKEASRFGCYSWAASGVVLYCGSFSQDYAGANYRTNLEGRLWQYFCNHRRDNTGNPINTNARIFDLLNEALKLSEVSVQLLSFESLEGARRTITFPAYATHPVLVKAVERLAIWTYREFKQCPWNDNFPDDEP